MELTYLRSGPGIVRSFLACSFSQTKDLELSFFPGDHRIGDVDSRLLFKIGYCLPDCALKNSQEPQDEHQQLNQVDRKAAKENGTTSKFGGDMEHVEEDTEGALLMTTRM